VSREIVLYTLQNVEIDSLLKPHTLVAAWGCDWFYILNVLKNCQLADHDKKVEREFLVYLLEPW
jgi:hypothetical protein